MPEPSILLIHGPATGAWIWQPWRHELHALGWQAIVLDLRGHGLSVPIDLSTVTMEDYVADVESVTSQIAATQGVHPVIGGWSTGALVALMYAAKHPETPALLLLSPSPPEEVGGRAPIDVVRRASGPLLGPEAFGVPSDGRGQAREALPHLTDAELDSLLQHLDGAEESGIAYRQVLRGVSMPAGTVQCPALVVHGSHESEAAGKLAAHLGGETLPVSVEDGWSIVWHVAAVEAAAPDVDAWLRRNALAEAT